MTEWSASSIDWRHPAPYIHEICVDATDMDGLQHSNNACYVKWCEQAAWQHSQQLGLGLDDYQRLDRAMAVRQAHYDYRLPTHAGDVLLVGTWLHNMSGAKMERSFQLVRLADRQTVLLAHWQLTCIEISSGKPKRLPEAFINAYGRAL